MAKTYAKPSHLLARVACTCPNSVLFALIEKYGVEKEMFENLLKIKSFSDLRKVTMFKDEAFQVFVIVSHFVGSAHYLHARQQVGITSEMPEDIRPALHQLLPLDKDSCYKYKKINLHLKNLIQIGSKQKGKGFWAAHLCGKIWISANEDMAGDIKMEQTNIDGFSESLRNITEVDVSQFATLYQNTFMAISALNRYV